MNRIYQISKKTIMLISILALLILSACTDTIDNSQIINQHNDLVQKFNNLEDEYNSSVLAYKELNADYQSYVSEVEKAEAQYREELERYVSEIKEFSIQLEKIYEGAIIPPYIIFSGRKASFTFRNLDNNLESWEYDVESLEESIILCRFMREIDIQDLKYLGATDVANRFYNGTKLIRFTGQGSFLDYRPYIMTTPFQHMAAGFYTRYTDDESRIREVWNMVTQLSTYTREVKETPRLPLETLLLGGGDCEDLAILTASILRAMSEEWSVKLVYMDSNNPLSTENLNHVTVHVDTGQYETFAESTQGNIMCPWEQVDGYYLEID